MTRLRRLLFGALCWLVATTAYAQVESGSITGVVTDDSGAILPGVTVTLTGERLIGGPQTLASDASGAYRFDRLPPGEYSVKFELQGFKSVDRTAIRINAAFVATINAKLEVGSLTETITVTGESPTVDTRSTLQQTVMDQAVLEGVPTGRDPWSLAKLIPGVQVATYDVGGTQSIQQSALSARGSSTNDVSYNIDGAIVNWPGGGGGATMLYYDQGMFEEVNYMTSAIPAEIMAGGVSINMVTKTAGNPWRGTLKYTFANGDLQSDNTQSDNLPAGFLGNPTDRTYDLNLSGGGAIVRNRVWFNGTIRRWVVDKFTIARNADGSRAIDDNLLKNYSGKVTAQVTTNQRVMFSYLWNDKIRNHRRDTPPDNVPDIASLVQTNPASSTQGKYTLVRNRLVYESNFNAMLGETKYNYQPDTPPDAIRVVDNTLSSANFAAQRRENQPNSRYQFDNIASYSKSGWGGDHLFKAGVQFARLSYEQQYEVQGDHWLIYENGLPNSVRRYNSPVNPQNISRMFGFFFQDAWTRGKLTLNLGARYDRNTGILPDQSAPAGTFIGAREVAGSTPVKQNIGVYRAGAAYDLFGNGRTALKASVSRYGLQVGIDRVTQVNPLQVGFDSCPWTDPNGNGRFDSGEVTFSQCSGFPTLTQRYADSNGPNWPYSDEVTAGFEHQLIPDMRVGVIYYYRTNKDQIGLRNVSVPSSAYTPFTINVPNGPNGATTTTLYNLNPGFLGVQDNVLDNQEYLDTDYQGVEFNATKRMSNNWQMTFGLTIGRNRGGQNQGGTTSGQSATAGDLNDPNITLFPTGIIGNDSTYALRLSGTYQAPYGVNVSGSYVSNTGYPYVSTYAVTRAIAAAQGIALTRASQTIFLSERGTERLPHVNLLDLAFSRPIKFLGNRQINPRIDIFNIFNVSTITTTTPGVGATYLRPTEIISPRIIRVGFSLDF